MADRRSLFSRFWPPSGSRRSTTTQTVAPPPATPDTAPTSSPSRRPTTTARTATPAAPSRRPTTTTQPKDEPKTTPPSSTNPKDEPKTTPPSSTNPKDETKATSPSSKNRTDEPKTSPSSTNPKDDPKTSPPSTNPIDDPKTSSPTSTNPIDAPKTTLPSSTNPIDAPKTSSPSRETTQSSSPSKPASPNHRLAKSRSPPQPSSPAPQAQNTGSQTPKRASHPSLKSPSPKVGPSSSPKKTQPKSPSKESTQPSQEISSYEKDIKPAASQQEPLLNASIETDSESFKPNEVGPTPSPSSGIDTAKPKEAEDLKEVVQATNTEANEEIKKENSGSEDQIIEKTEILSKPDRVQREKTSGLTPGNTRNSQSEIKSTISIPYNKSAQSNRKHTPEHKQMATGDPKGDISDKHISVITLAGENRGASIQVQSNSSKQEGAVHIHRSYKINPDESPEATTDGEGSSDQKKTKDANSKDDQPTETYVNNNAQGINNSIVFNSSITEGSPGVHMVVTHLPKEQIQSTNKAETQKAEFNTTRAEKLTYQPTVRRRCLKGLLLETSDSDPDNPEKPRRHGCRVGCEKKEKENNVDVL